MIKRKSRRGELGQALVEFSLSFIAFAALILGMIDAGRAVWNYNTLAEATREGTRYAIVHGASSSNPSGPGDTQDVVDEVEQFAGGLNTDQLSVTVTWPDTTNEPGDRVTVESVYTYEPIFGLLGPISFDLRSESTMTITN
jgi:Flp pilus assembly protein TadG